MAPLDCIITLDSSILTRTETGCKDCQQDSLKSQHYVDSNLRIPNVLMACIAMDLLEKYSEMIRGHCYALTVICMLTSFVEVIPIEDKKD